MDYYLQRLRRLAINSDDPESKNRYIAALERVIGGQSVELPPSQLYTPLNENDEGYGLETVVHTLNGTQIRCEASAETSFIRVCDETGEEIVYWDIEEIREDPGTVVHALVHYAAYGKPQRCHYCDVNIYDARNMSGSITADWATADGDFGCDESPDTTEEGVGSHLPQ